MLSNIEDAVVGIIEKITNDKQEEVVAMIAIVRYIQP